MVACEWFTNLVGVALMIGTASVNAPGHLKKRPGDGLVEMSCESLFHELDVIEFEAAVQDLRLGTVEAAE